MGLGGEQYPVEREDYFAQSSDGRELHQTSVWMDLTKSRRSNVYEHFSRLEEMLASGTAVRKTNRAGPGTKGTPAVEPITKGSFLLIYSE